MTYTALIKGSSPIGYWKLNGSGSAVIGTAATVSNASGYWTTPPLVANSTSSLKIKNAGASVTISGSSFNHFYKNYEDKVFSMEFWFSLNGMMDGSGYINNLGEAGYLGNDAKYFLNDKLKIVKIMSELEGISQEIASVMYDYRRNTFRFSFSGYNNTDAYIPVRNLNTSFHIIVTYTNRVLKIVVNGEQGAMGYVNDTSLFRTHQDSSVFYSIDGESLAPRADKSFIIGDLAMYDYELTSSAYEKRIVIALSPDKPMSITNYLQTSYFDFTEKNYHLIYKDVITGSKFSENNFYSENAVFDEVEGIKYLKLNDLHPPNEYPELAYTSSGNYTYQTAYDLTKIHNPHSQLMINAHLNAASWSAAYGFGHRPLWFKYTTSASGNIELSTEGSSYDTVINVYKGDPSTASWTAYDDDSGPGRTSYISIELEADTTYYIEIIAYAIDDEGILNFKFSGFGLNPSNNHGLVFDQYGQIFENELYKVISCIFMPNNASGGYIFSIPNSIANNRTLYAYATAPQLIDVGTTNDLFANAIDLSTLTSPISFSTEYANASLETGEPFSLSPFSDSDNYGYSVWFKYTPSIDADLSIFATETVTASSNYAALGIYTGSQVDNLTLVDYSTGLPSSISLLYIPVEAGTTYYITAATWGQSGPSASPAQWVLTGDWEYSGPQSESKGGVIFGSYDVTTNKFNEIERIETELLSHEEYNFAIAIDKNDNATAFLNDISKTFTIQDFNITFKNILVIGNMMDSPAPQNLTIRNFGMCSDPLNNFIGFNFEQNRMLMAKLKYDYSVSQMATVIKTIPLGNFNSEIIGSRISWDGMDNCIVEVSANGQNWDIVKRGESIPGINYGSPNRDLLIKMSIPYDYTIESFNQSFNNLEISLYRSLDFVSQDGTYSLKSQTQNSSLPAYTIKRHAQPITFRQDKPGVFFDSVNGYVNGYAKITATSSVTNTYGMDFWFKPESFTSASNYLIHVSASTDYYVYISGSTNKIIYSPSTSYLYINGSSVTSNSYTASPGEYYHIFYNLGASVNNSSSIILNGRAGASGTHSNGSYAHLNIWNDPITLSTPSSRYSNFVSNNTSSVQDSSSVVWQSNWNSSSIISVVTYNIG